MQTFTLEKGGAFCFQPLKETEIDEARRLCDQCVGENLYSRDEIAAAIGASDKGFYLLKTAAGETVGYLYYYLTDGEQIAKYAKLGMERLRVVYPTLGKPVGKIQSVGIKPEYRGSGLAVQMIRFALNELKKLGVDIAFIVCWKPGGKVPLAKTLAECRFCYLAETKKVWYDDTALICPYCKGRCVCDAEVFYKLL